MAAFSFLFLSDQQSCLFLHSFPFIFKLKFGCFSSLVFFKFKFSSCVLDGEFHFVFVLFNYGFILELFTSFSKNFSILKFSIILLLNLHLILVFLYSLLNHLLSQGFFLSLYLQHPLLIDFDLFWNFFLHQLLTHAFLQFKSLVFLDFILFDLLEQLLFVIFHNFMNLLLFCFFQDSKFMWELLIQL